MVRRWKVLPEVEDKKVEIGRVALQKALELRDNPQLKMAPNIPECDEVLEVRIAAEKWNELS